MVNLNKLRRDAKLFDRAWSNFERMLKNLNQRHRDIRNNERMLVSRNKREGWYSARHKSQRINPKTKMFESVCAKCFRIHSKAWALRYRKQTGAQLMRVKGLK
jgi:hypothetical protein